jgi:hypothetical protein
MCLHTGHRFTPDSDAFLQTLAEFVCSSGSVVSAAVCRD